MYSNNILKKDLFNRNQNHNELIAKHPSNNDLQATTNDHLNQHRPHTTVNNTPASQQVFSKNVYKSGVNQSMQMIDSVREKMQSLKGKNVFSKNVYKN